MRDVKAWGDYFLEMASHVATRSKDDSTQVGAVLVDENHGVIETGYNGFAPRIKETEERWQRPTKYDLVIHAEVNAIARAAKAGKKVDGATLYVTHFPCKECAKVVIAAGVKRVITPEQRFALGSGSSIQYESAKQSMDYLTEAGVVCYPYYWHVEGLNDSKIQ